MVISVLCVQVVVRCAPVGASEGGVHDGWKTILKGDRQVYKGNIEPLISVGVIPWRLREQRVVVPREGWFASDS